jgi:hypothetical protein
MLCKNAAAAALKTDECISRYLRRHEKRIM